MKKAALYVRVSTEEQVKEGYSLDAQKNILNEYCISEDWEVYAVYEDDGYSGRNIKRPAYTKMMADIQNWDILLVLKMDRIHRNSRNFMDMMDVLNKNEKSFVSCMESLDTTNAMGRFVMDMIQRIAQLESEQIGERTYIGMKEKAETLTNSVSTNKTMGFNAPFGYVLEEGILRKEQHEFEAVESIFLWYSQGYTQDMIAYNLNSSGIPTRKGNAWNKYNIRNILHNPIYAGFMEWDGVLIKHYAGRILTVEEFNEIQQQMASKVRDPKKRNLFIIPPELSDESSDFAQF